MYEEDDKWLFSTVCISITFLEDFSDLLLPEYSGIYAKWWEGNAAEQFKAVLQMPGNNAKHVQ